jgi:hypothetical protein
VATDSATIAAFAVAADVLGLTLAEFLRLFTPAIRDHVIVAERDSQVIVVPRDLDN